MLNSSIRCCLRMQRTLEISCLSSNRLVFSSVRVNPSVRYLSVSSGKLSDNSSSDLDKLIGDTISDKRSEIELLFEAKAPAPTPTSPTEVVEVDSAVFTDGASSLLSSAPVDPLLSLAEPPFTSLGLAHMWPSGWLQAFLETLHIDLGNVIIIPVLSTSKPLIPRVTLVAGYRSDHSVHERLRIPHHGHGSEGNDQHE